MSRYAAAHANPNGPGDARPTALQIVRDEGAEGKLKDKVVVITGTSSGIGIETARAFSETGARLFLTARDLDKAKSALEAVFDPDRMELIQMNQTSLDSVRTAAKQILNKTNKVNILIENAGVMAVPNLEFTTNGHELQFGVNHLSHFLFFQLLKPALLAAVTPELNSRVVVVASSAHLAHSINEPDNYNFEKSDYDPWTAYSQSKTANVYMANELDRRYGSQGLHATSLHPGGIMTPLARHLGDGVAEAIASTEEARAQMKNPEQGAATTLWAAVGKEWEHKGGIYLEDCGETQLCESPKGHFAKGHAKHAYDPERERRLWEDSLRLVGLS
ncbi:alcohol dehydrogenase [Paramyrothecium foliicola]|nr:alcohol dehydrogenase [Paramyrothecium foliicola]